MKELIPHFKRYWQDPWIKKGLLLFLASFLVVQLFFEPIKKESPLDPHQSEGSETHLSDLIPKGFALVPVQFANEDALLSLVDDFAHADLFIYPKADFLELGQANFGQANWTEISPQQKRSRNLRVLRGIRILKKPGEQFRFSALVTQNQVEQLVRPQVAVVAVIINRDNNLTPEAPQTSIRFNQLKGGI